MATTKGPNVLAGAQICRIDSAMPRFGGEAVASMQLARESECSIWLRPVRVSVDDLAIVNPPSNGSLRVRGQTGVIYRPAKGFTGDDAFVFALKAHEGAVSKSAVVHVRVSVR